MSPSRKLRSFATALAFSLLSATHAGVAGTTDALDRASAEVPRPAESAARATEARKQYARGTDAYRRGDYEAAIAAFIAADLLIPSAALSFDVGRAYEKLRDIPNAVIWYRDFLRRSGFLADRARLEERVAALEAGLHSRGPTRLSVSSSAVLSLAVDGKAVGATPWAGLLSPGPHELVVESWSCPRSSPPEPVRRPR